MISHPDARHSEGYRLKHVAGHGRPIVQDPELGGNARRG